MSTNKVDFQVTDEFFTSISTKFAELIALLTFLIDLDVDGRRRLFKMGRKNLDFVTRGLKLAELYPRLLPSYVTLSQYQNDVSLFIWLRKFQEELAALLDKVDDTAMQAEAESFRAARGLLKSAREAAVAGDEEAERTVKDLAPHYKRSKSSRVQEPEPEATEE